MLLRNLVVLFFAPLLATAPLAAQELKSFIKKLQPSLVSVVISEELEKPATGDVATANERKHLLTLSGIVWSRKGEILTLLRDGLPVPTPEHRIVIGVECEEGRFSARSVATDEYTGVTLIALAETPKTLRPARLSRVKLELGDDVVALGKAGALPSFQIGHVTNPSEPLSWVRGRTMSIPRTIRTNIRAMPGDIGGILALQSGVVGMLAFELNEQGRIDTSRLHGSLGARLNEPASAAGIVCAIPVDLLDRIVADLQQHSRVRRCALGGIVLFRPRAEGCANSGAIEVREVTPGGALSRAGLASGDLLVQIDDRLIRTWSDFYWLLERIEYGKVGDTVVFKYIRPNLNDSIHPATVLLLESQRAQSPPPSDSAAP
ncbi:MAG: S1C family serine protease [Planctomycetota bacterium]